MSEHEFGPGEYRMRNGCRAVIYESLCGWLFGRRLSEISGHWLEARWRERDGGCPADTRFDLLPPEPPIVVSDEAMQAYIDVYNNTRNIGLRSQTRAGLAAAFAVMLKERGE